MFCFSAVEQQADRELPYSCPSSNIFLEFWQNTQNSSDLFPDIRIQSKCFDHFRADA
jgi:hypothetical protein